jgi:hypothetical protein
VNKIILSSVASGALMAALAVGVAVSDRPATKNAVATKPGAMRATLEAGSADLPPPPSPPIEAPPPIMPAPSPHQTDVLSGLTLPGIATTTGVMLPLGSHLTADPEPAGDGSLFSTPVVSYKDTGAGTWVELLITNNSDRAARYAAIIKF